MNPLLTVAMGIVLGALGVRAGRDRMSTSALSDKANAGARKVRARLGRAGDGVRNAAVSGLSAVEKGSADVRRRLEVAASEPGADEASSEIRKSTELTADGSDAGTGGK